MTTTPPWVTAPKTPPHRLEDCTLCRLLSADDDTVKYTHPSESVAYLEPLNPATPGHLLFLPTHHFESAATDPFAVSVVFTEAAKYAAAHGIKDFNLLTSAGAAATQTQFHLHVHLIPRGADDTLPDDWPWAGTR